MAASLAPLQVFIFVYAFVGPLHYLTEIAWLKKKDFYFGGGVVSERVYVAIAAVLCAAVSVDYYVHRGITGYAIGLLMVLSLGAIVKNPYRPGLGADRRVCGQVFCAWVGDLCRRDPADHRPCVRLHDAVYGERARAGTKRRSVLAWSNPFLLLGLPVVLLMARWSYPAPGSYWINAEAGFSALHGYLVRLVGHNLHPDASILADPAAAGVLRFLAFIYLFHYLNWFAKTELLQWHRVSRRSWAWIALLYSVSVGCYLWNFVVGFYIVNFLSMLHVFLEFPLNWHTGRFLTASIARLWSGPQREKVTA